LVGVGDKVETGEILARLDDSDRQENLTDAQRDLRELTSASAIASIDKELANTKIDLEDEITNLVGLISPAVYKAENYMDDYTIALAEAQATAEESPSDENDLLLKTAEQNHKWAVSNLTLQWAYYEDVYLPEEYESFYWDGDHSNGHITKMCICPKSMNPFTGMEMKKFILQRHLQKPRLLP